MKLLNVLLALFFVFVFNTKAEAYGSSSNSGTSLGIIGGFRYNNLAVPGVLNNLTSKYTPGYQVGLYLSFPVNDTVMLRFGALYGDRAIDYTNGAGDVARNHAMYVDLPAALQISLSSEFYLLVGQITGFKMSENCEAITAGTTCSAQGLAATNMSSIAGFGWNAFDLGSTGKFSLEIVYEYGLNNTFAQYNTNTASVLANGILRFGL